MRAGRCDKAGGPRAFLGVGCGLRRQSHQRLVWLLSCARDPHRRPHARPSPSAPGLWRLALQTTSGHWWLLSSCFNLEGLGATRARREPCRADLTGSPALTLGFLPLRLWVLFSRLSLHPAPPVLVGEETAHEANPVSDRQAV